MKSLLATMVFGLTAGLVASGVPARAASFGPASMGYSTDTSNVSYDLNAGTLDILPTASFSYNGGNDSYFSDVNTGTPGSAFQFSGLIPFATTPGVLKPVNLPDLISIVTPGSGTYDFSADAVGTASLSSNATNGDQLTLYLEGTMGGGNANDTPSATDVILNMTNLAGLGGTLSGTVFNPPSGSDPFTSAVASPVSEPASWTVLGLGVGGLLAWRLRTRKAARRAA